MKSVISVIAGITTFIGGFILSGKLINYISSIFSHPDVILLSKIVLWIVFFGGIFWLSFIIGLAIGSLVYNILPKFKRNVSNNRK